MIIIIIATSLSLCLITFQAKYVSKIAFLANVREISIFFPMKLFAVNNPHAAMLDNSKFSRCFFIHTINMPF